MISVLLSCTEFNKASNTLCSIVCLREAYEKVQPDLLQGALDLLALKTFRPGQLTAGTSPSAPSRSRRMFSESDKEHSTRRSIVGGASLNRFRVGASENNRKAKFYNLTAAGGKQISNVRLFFVQTASSPSRSSGCRLS